MLRLTFRIHNSQSVPLCNNNPTPVYACNRIQCNNQVSILHSILMDCRILLLCVLAINCWCHVDTSDTMVISIFTGNPLFIITSGRSSNYITANISFSKFAKSNCMYAFCLTATGVLREDAYLLMTGTNGHGTHSFTANQNNIFLAFDNRGNFQILHTGALIDHVRSWVLIKICSVVNQTVNRLFIKFQLTSFKFR